MADDTIAFIDTVSIGRADVVAWSDGAGVALRRPDLVRKLVRIGQPVNPDEAHPQASLRRRVIPTPEHAVAMRDALRDGRLEILRGRDHGFPMQDPVTTGRLIRDFLAE